MESPTRLWYFCLTCFSPSPISHWGDSLPTICLIFIVYPTDIYEFTLYTFYCSKMCLCIVYFVWRRVIIYDNNLSYRSLSQAKRKIYIFLLSLFERKNVDTCCERFKTCFLIENLPRTIFFVFEWCFFRNQESLTSIGLLKSIFIFRSTCTREDDTPFTFNPPPVWPYFTCITGTIVPFFLTPPRHPFLTGVIFPVLYGTGTGDNCYSTTPSR